MSSLRALTMPCLVTLLVCLSVTAAPGNDSGVLAGRLGPDGEVGDVLANAGEPVAVDFFYVDPTSNLQGYSLAFCFDCGVEGIDGSFSIEGTIVETIGAEFINSTVDNDPGDGDGCELVIGVLLDALPPFDGQTLPPTIQPLRFGSFEFLVPDGTPCFSCFAVEFCEGVNGGGGTAIFNTFVIENNSVTPAEMRGTLICTPADVPFVRGDVNNDGVVNIADIVSILNFLFQMADPPVCLDAADTDDDGNINITDSVFLSLYIFLEGLPPRPPFPECGLEPIPDEDDLDCVGPTAMCPSCP